ncbi:hypothetical protein [Clostridium botulinum]|uniref:hypothetical protein n=1 Tax=Clostridium botulinum TaxID=1491 RepID=UPI0004D026D2|nr:hypothetical protein [Clostridium botulinum]
MGKKSDFLNNGWVQKTVRISKDYMKVCSFLDYIKSNLDQDDKYSFFDNLFNYSMDFINQNGFRYKIKRRKGEGKRIPKGFLMKETTYETINISYQMYSRFNDIYIAEYYELLLYIYCNNKLSERDKELLGQIDWGIE